MKTSCELREQSNNAGPFGRLAPAALKDLKAIQMVSSYPQGSMIFMERQTARGVYLLLEGEAKLTVSSSEGKTLILRITTAGNILGLAAALSAEPHESTAEALRPCRVAFIRRESLLRFLQQHPEAYEAVIGQMSSQYGTACKQLRTVGLTSSVSERLAGFLLDFSAGGQQTKEGTRFTMSLTHEEIAECIGTTRETVSRTFSDFKARRLLEVRGATLMLQNPAALRQLAA